MIPLSFLHDQGMDFTLSSRWNFTEAQNGNCILAGNDRILLK